MKVKDPKALVEVRRWKAKLNKKVAHLPSGKAVRKALTDSIEAAKDLNLASIKPSRPVAAANRKRPIRLKESKALLEVRSWKAAASKSVAHLPLREALKKRIQDSAKSAKRLGFGPRKHSATK